MSATCCPNSQIWVLLANISLSWQHRTNPDTVFLCQGLPTFAPFLLLLLPWTMPHPHPDPPPLLALPFPLCPCLSLPVLPLPLAATINDGCYHRRRQLPLPLPQPAGHHVLALFVFAPTGPFLLHFSMLQDLCTTAKSQIEGGCMISSVPCKTRQQGSSRLIQLSVRLTNPSSSSRCRIISS